MPKVTYTDLVSKIEQLQTKAQAVKKQEAAGVIARIKEAIAFYELTPADLFGAKVPKKAAGKGRKAKRAVKYRDEAGNTWIGMGKRPDWLRNALAAGKTLEDFRV